MGEYSELFFRCNLNPNLDIKTLLVIENLLKIKEAQTVEIPNHEFFNTQRFDYALIGSSAYHVTGESYLKLRKEEINLFVHSSLKNYEGEFEKFIDWIEPYLEDHGLLGWILSPNESNPRLIYTKEE
jgi:hypothetical protein